MNLHELSDGMLLRMVEDHAEENPEFSGDFLEKMYEYLEDNDELTLEDRQTLEKIIRKHKIKRK